MPDSLEKRTDPKGEESMQFIKRGPNIPEALLQAHEEGRVVFFCGAGISYPAGLPGFQGLVDRIYEEVSEERTPFEDKAYRKEKYDATLDLLEHRLRSRFAIRKPLITILKPKSINKKVTKTHEALIQLSQGRDGAVRLVTTNFDNLFQHVVERAKLRIPSFCAPMLPIPKDSRWNGIVYLHGLLPAITDENALNRLVLTSGDFGLAYLTERWASRFVSELFRGYVVCFVGYSINDPVLRYMMDALAADRMMGEPTPQAYAFGDFRRGEETDILEEWKAKGVVPILYEVPTGSHDHSGLHNTLAAWADTYRDGVAGLERIVAQCANGLPLASTTEDDFVGRALWALSDPSGLPAKRFADFDPAPSLDWLEPFGDLRYKHSDLTRFGVSSLFKRDDKLAFSFILRPTPYTRAPWMQITARSASGSGWDDVMVHIARWLTRHLDNPKLVLWLAKQGGLIHDNFSVFVNQRIDELDRLAAEKKNDDLARLLENAPQARPRPVMRTLWRLLLAGRVKSPWREFDLYQWKDSYKRDGLTPLVRMSLRDALMPKVKLNEPFRLEGDSNPSSERLRDLVGWELVLSSDYPASALKEFRQSGAFQKDLPLFLTDFQSLLHEALEILRELGAADERFDNSHWDHPSISPHRQNQGFKEWVVLIDLVRDAWLESEKLDPEKARSVALAWWQVPYPTFKRLALYAAATTNLIPNSVWVDWLLAEDGWWLWSIETRRETLRLLVHQGQKLSQSELRRLEVGILSGPPKRMYRQTISENQWAEELDHAVWLRLAKMESADVQFGKPARDRLAKISKAHPKWKLAANQSDEFSHWMSGTGDPEFESRRKFNRAPRNRKKLMEWLQRPQPKDPMFYGDDWREVCRDRFPLAATALYALSRKGVWPVPRWTDALQTWGSEQHGSRSWRYLAPVVSQMPRELIIKLANQLAWWIEAASKHNRIHHQIFMNLIGLILEVKFQDTIAARDPINTAINHPVGLITMSLIQDLFIDPLEDGQGLRPDLKIIFTQLADREVQQFLYARVILAHNLVSLFRIDPTWTKEKLLPGFDWSLSINEARAAWGGFLWAGRFYWPLIEVLKSHLLETVNHYSEFQEHGRQYAALLTHAALDPGSVLSRQELRLVFATLPEEAIAESIHTLTLVLQSAGEKQRECWENRILPFIKSVWPKSKEFTSKTVGQELAILAIAAGDAFPSALETLGDSLTQVDHCHWVLSQLHEAKLSTRFPREALTLLDKIIGERPEWIHKELKDCLNEILSGWPAARRDRKFRRLEELMRRLE